ncbi:MAG TPA: NADH-quinone oxidoreductase subunit M [Chitinophagaceae bacterium]|nr:NADH-quinone oxidoreductase subunit M [Chitinophagaceae bacterium]
MIPVLLILIPLISGLLTFFIKNEKAVRGWVLFSSVITLCVSILGLTVLKNDSYLQFRMNWMSTMNASFSLRLDGMGQILCLLTSVSFPLVFISTWESEYKKPANFFGLMLLMQVGLMGVFLSMDALLFYFFWELALIPAYFLCSQWGGEKRIAVTFKFFIYTFTGSILMLVAIIYIYMQTPTHSFDITAFYNTPLANRSESWLFWLMFIAFAIKMPIWPLHTWQPDTYEQAPTAVTMILSGVMVKMGVLGIIRWLMPVLHLSFYQWGDTVSTLAITGMIYASLIAIRQDDLKRLVAYSSIAHMGLMCATLFSETQSGMQGVMIQMFNHGINIIGLWIVIELIERQFGTRKISELGGLAQRSPAMAILLVIVALANIGLPLTNGFIGEFLMFNGIFASAVTKYYIVFTVLAGITIILAAVYTLNMIRKVFYGEANTLTAPGYSIRFNEKMALGIIVAFILVIGIYPNIFLNITQETSEFILKKADVTSLFSK